MRNLEQAIKKLPPALRREVEDFVGFLLEKQKLEKKKPTSKKETGRKLRQDWAGGLREFRDQYTSLELQKKALEWRGD